MSHTLPKRDLRIWQKETRGELQDATACLRHAEYKVAKLTALLAWLDGEIEKAQS